MPRARDRRRPRPRPRADRDRRGARDDRVALVDVRRLHAARDRYRRVEDELAVEAPGGGYVAHAWRDAPILVSAAEPRFETGKGAPEVSAKTRTGRARRPGTRGTPRSRATRPESRRPARPPATRSGPDDSTRLLARARRSARAGGTPRTTPRSDPLRARERRRRAERAGRESLRGNGSSRAEPMRCAAPGAIDPVIRARRPVVRLPRADPTRASRVVPCRSRRRNRGRQLGTIPRAHGGRGNA